MFIEHVKEELSLKFRSGLLSDAHKMYEALAMIMIETGFLNEEFSR